MKWIKVKRFFAGLALSAGILALVACHKPAAGTTTYAEESEVVTIGEESYDLGFYESYDFMVMVDTDDYTEEFREENAGNLIVERIIGVVLDEDGNGQIINTESEEYNYISYSDVSGISVGNVVLTYCVHNADNTEADDVIYRVDYIIDDRESSM